MSGKKLSYQVKSLRTLKKEYFQSHTHETWSTVCPDDIFDKFENGSCWVNEKVTRSDRVSHNI